MKAFATLLVFCIPACLMPPAGSSSGPAYSGGPSSGYASSGSPDSSSSNSFESTATPAAAPAAPSTVSVTIRSACSQTVKVFYGEKPKFGSGTYSSISSNSVQSHTFRPGEMLWIVDESENGLASATISESTRELEIGSSCGSIAAR